MSAAADGEPDPLDPIRDGGNPNHVNLPGFKDFRASVPKSFAGYAGICR